ncbi:MAG: flippase-like domain-containing protein, partial [Candidatus Sumerlaeia bacterium]|nr:flippase-like domain-containing protein [Candidatus Sumerlaeia bacterium]
MKKQRTQLIIGIGLSAFFLWLAFRRVDFQHLWVTLKGINYWWLIPFIIVTLLSMYVRAIRWKYLFMPRYLSLIHI